MSKDLKRVQVLILIAVLLAGVLALTMPTYAGGAYSEITYAAKSARYYPKTKTAKVTIRWSKAYARLKDGTIKDATGYEIEYSPYRNFSKARRVRKTSKYRTAVIRIKRLYTRRDYNYEMSRLRFRIRSYVRVGGKRQYSKWVMVANTKTIRAVTPVALSSIAAKQNVVTAKWERVPGCDGYVVYYKKSNSAKWRKFLSTTNKKLSKFVAKDLDYGREYEFSVLSYKYLRTQDPRRFKTSTLSILNTKANLYNMAIPKLVIEPPEFSAEFKEGKLNVTFGPVELADTYYVEVATTPDFAEPRVGKIKASKLKGKESYTKKVSKFNKETDIYVRVRASKLYKKKVYYSADPQPLTMNYRKSVYTLVLDGNGNSSGTMAPIEIAYGEVLKLPKNTYKRSGYKFAGWSVKKNNKIYLKNYQLGKVKYQNEGEVTELAEPGQTVTLYACWKGSGPKAAADWAKRIADNDDYYYPMKGQKLNHCYFCQSGEKYYNCNSMVNGAYTHGMPYFKKYQSGSTYPDWWEKQGFKKVGQNLSASQIKKGDVICCHNGKRWSHVMIALSTTKVVNAANKGKTPASLAVIDLPSKLKRYKKTMVLRLES